MKNKIALIDGYGFVFRAYHSLPPLTRPDGTPVGAVYGFTNMLLRLIAGLHVSHIAVVFDSGSKTFRNDIYKDYKANRPPCPPDLIPQFPLIREAAESLNIHVLEKVGFEADDLIATIAKGVDKKDFDVVIVSSDKDLMQLIDDNIVMYDAMKNRVISYPEVQEKFSVTPDKVLDVLSLMGDSSDNVPGVKGIGPKTAAELINQYGNLENLLDHLDEIKQDKRREMLKSGVENAKLSKILISLREDVPVDMNMKDYEVKIINPHKLIKFLENQGFKSLVTRIKKEFKIDDLIESTQVSLDFGDSNSSKELILAQNNSPAILPNNLPEKTDSTIPLEQIEKIIVKNIAEIKNLKNEIFENGNFIFDIEFSPENKDLATSLIISSAADNSSQKKIFYIPLKEEKHSVDGDFDLFSVSKKEEGFVSQNDKEFASQNKKEFASQNGLIISEVLEELKEIFTHNAITKIGYQIKESIKFLAGNNIEIDIADDIAVMAYVLNSSVGQSDLRVLISTNLTSDIESNGFGAALEAISKNKLPEIFGEIEKKQQFYFFKNYAIWQLHKILKPQISKEKLNLVYLAFEKPLINVLAEIEQNGVAVDKIKLKNLSEEFDKKIKELSLEIYKMAGEEFNIGSPKQLGHILFEKLSLTPGKKSKKTGALSTNSAVLEELSLEGFDIADKILEWRHISKLKSTYSDSLPKEINSKTNRIHTTFSNITAITGRLSSIHPNLQNIPIRSLEGLKIRAAFVAEKGKKLIAADYSQVELRVLAHIAKIDALKKAFAENKDVHAITAAQVFGVAENEVDSEMRRKAKGINFGIIYGISAFGLANQLRISRSEASNYIKAYFETYPGIQDYMNKYQEMAKNQGYVTTIIGRKCFIPDAGSKNPTLRGIADRLAINAPIQGSAADIIKKAMLDLSAKLKEQKLETKLILQVHDELILEAPTNEIEKVTALLKSTMENAFILDVPLKVDVEVSDYWS